MKSILSLVLVFLFVGHPAAMAPSSTMAANPTIIVVLLDDGLNLQEFQDYLLPNPAGPPGTYYQFNAWDGGPAVEDWGHGDAVAWVIRDNLQKLFPAGGGIGQVYFVPVQVAGPNEKGSAVAFENGTTWALSLQQQFPQAFVVWNESLGGFGYDDIVDQNHAECQLAGGLPVVGTDDFPINVDAGAGDYPGAETIYLPLIAVGGTDEDGNLAVFSGYGMTVRVFAQAINVQTSVSGFGDGVSVAVPQVTAAVAAVKLDHPELDRWGILQWVCLTGTPPNQTFAGKIAPDGSILNIGNLNADVSSQLKPIPTIEVTKITSTKVVGVIGIAEGEGIGKLVGLAAFPDAKTVSTPVPGEMAMDFKVKGLEITKKTQLIIGSTEGPVVKLADSRIHTIRRHTFGNTDPYALLER
jgi:hypothetical protein